MAWNDPTETVVAGSGEVYVGPVGTALPASASAALNGAFTGLGYHTEDGVSVNQSPEIVEHRAWQSKFPIRRERDTEDFQLTFALEQWNETNLPFVFGGGEVLSLGGGQYRYNPPTPDDSLDARALILDVDDGTRRLRFVVPKGSVFEGVESQFTRSQLGVLPVTFKALEPDDAGLAWYLLSNDSAAFATGS